ncbi:GntR family transcriptional regulator, partial [Planctomycetota bacterium]
MAGLVFQSKKTVSQQISEAIIKLIRQDGYGVSDFLPSYRDLAARFEVSLVTIKKAMDLLVGQGLVVNVPAKGCYVNKDISDIKRKMTQIGMIFYGTNQLFFSSAYAQEIFQGIMLQAEGVRADVRHFSIKHQGRIPPAEILASGVEGVILVGIVNEEYLQEFVANGIPAVVVDYHAPELALDFVVCDNAKASQRAVAHLAALGHKDIAYIGGYATDTVAGSEGHDPATETSDIVERREGYQQAMRAAGLEKQINIHSIRLGAQEELSAIAVELAAGPSRPTAILAYDTSMAADLIHELQKADVEVPRDVSVAAVAGASDGIVDEMLLTNNRFQFVEMGRRAVDRLAKRFGGDRPGAA